MSISDESKAPDDEALYYVPPNTIHLYERKPPGPPLTGRQLHNLIGLVDIQLNALENQARDADNEDRTLSQFLEVLGNLVKYQENIDRKNDFAVRHFFQQKNKIMPIATKLIYEDKYIERIRVSLQELQD